MRNLILHHLEAIIDEAALLSVHAEDCSYHSLH